MEEIKTNINPTDNTTDPLLHSQEDSKSHCLSSNILRKVVKSIMYVGGYCAATVGLSALTIAIEQANGIDSRVVYIATIVCSFIGTCYAFTGMFLILNNPLPEDDHLQKYSNV